MAGTACYRAPEVIGKSLYNCKSDIWALGCILYELLVGEKLYSSDWDMWGKVERNEPLSLPQKGLISEHWKRALTCLLTNMLWRDPAKRVRASVLLTNFAFHYQLHPHADNNADTLPKFQYPAWYIGYGVNKAKSHIACEKSSMFALINKHQIVFWDVVQGMYMRDITTRLHEIRAAAIHGGVRLLALVGQKIIRFWDTDSCSEIVRYNTKKSVTALKFNHRGDRLAYATLDGKIYSVRLVRSTRRKLDVSYEKMFGQSCESEGALEIGYHNDDSVLFASYYANLALWDCRTGECIAMHTFPELDSTYFVFHPKRYEMLCWNPISGMIETFNAISGGRLGSLMSKDGAESCTYSPCGKYIVSSHRFEGVKVWNASRHKLVSIFEDICRGPLWFCWGKNDILLTLGDEGFLLCISLENEIKKYHC